MTTGYYLLRVKEIGLTLAELHDLPMGAVLDMFIEKSNDSYDYKEVATQSDFDRF